MNEIRHYTFEIHLLIIVDLGLQNLVFFLKLLLPRLPYQPGLLCRLVVPRSLLPVPEIRIFLRFKPQ